LKDTFEVMEILIYDANIDITLEKVECLNNFEILKLLMTSVSNAMGFSYLSYYLLGDLVFYNSVGSRKVF